MQDRACKIKAILLEAHSKWHRSSKQHSHSSAWHRPTESSLTLS